MKNCDHRSSGILVFDCADRLLLIERQKFPYGYAPPAGHVDDHGTFEMAARNELAEEVGLVATKLDLVFSGKLENLCRRDGGTWHYWKVFKAQTEGELQLAPSEVKSSRWCSLEEFRSLASRTRRYRVGMITDEEWIRNPGIEPVWIEIMNHVQWGAL